MDSQNVFWTCLLENMEEKTTVTTESWTSVITVGHSRYYQEDLHTHHTSDKSTKQKLPTLIWLNGKESIL
jgi:hypothetical protein